MGETSQLSRWGLFLCSIFHVDDNMYSVHQLHKELQDTIRVYFFPFKSELSSSMQPLRGRLQPFLDGGSRHVLQSAHTLSTLSESAQIQGATNSTQKEHGVKIWRRKKVALFGGETNSTACATNWPGQPPILFCALCTKRFHIWGVLSDTESSSTWKRPA